MQSYKRPYAIIAALTGLFALALQFRLMLGYAAASDETAFYGTLRYCSFFTVFANALATLSLFATAASAKPNFLNRAGVQTAIAVYFIVVCTVYTLLLRNLWNPQGAQALANYLLHYGMPFMYWIYWLVFVPHGKLRYSNALLWLSYPTIYVTWVIARGMLFSDYPYGFLDAGVLGYTLLTINVIALGALFIVFGLVAIWIDGKLAKAPH